MKNIKIYVSLLLCFIMILSVFSACSTGDTETVSSEKVLINGKETNTVEASLGAFEGKQGDYIEFIFTEPTDVNAVYIIEKTANIRQFNIFAKIGGKYRLVYTGKNVLTDNCRFNTVKAEAIKFSVVNTDIQKTRFIIQGISIYNIKDGYEDTTLPVLKEKK